MRCQIEGNEIVVRMPIDALPVAWDASPLNDHDPDAGNLYPVTDAALFAREVVTALSDEEEDGTTLLHRAFDQAMSNAVDQGAEGVGA